MHVSIALNSEPHIAPINHDRAAANFGANRAPKLAVGLPDWLAIINAF
jgi:hypothetical protein